MHKFLKIFPLGGENHSQKTSKSDGFFQKITAAHHPEAACSIVAFEHKKRAEFSENLQFFFRVHKFLKIFRLGVKITGRKPANLMDTFQKTIAFWEEFQSAKWKDKKIQNLQKFPRFFQNAKPAEDFLFGRWKSQPENQQIWWIFSRKSLPRTTPRRRVL